MAKNKSGNALPILAIVFSSVSMILFLVQILFTASHYQIKHGFGLSGFSIMILSICVVTLISMFPAVFFIICASKYFGGNKNKFLSVSLIAVSVSSLLLALNRLISCRKNLNARDIKHIIPEIIIVALYLIIIVFCIVALVRLGRQKTFKPFHIKFAKPLQALKSDSKNKQSNITTYRINFSKLIPNKINLPYNNKINKTQEINNQINNNNLIALKKNINNKNKNINNNNNKILITNSEENIKKNNTINYNNSNSNNNNSIKYKNNTNNKDKSTDNKNDNNNNDNKDDNKNIDKYNFEDLKNNNSYDSNDFIIHKNISNLDEFNNMGDSLFFMNNNNNNFNNNSDDNSNESEEENSGVLAYDEVRDIIIYYDMSEINKKDNSLFYKNDYEIFKKKREKILDYFFNNNINKNKNKNNNIKTPTTNESSQGKKNFINVIKENLNL